VLTEFFVEDSVVMGYDAASVSDVSKKCNGFIFSGLSKGREPDYPITQNHISEQGDSRTRHSENPKLEFCVTDIIEKIDSF
jgi:hypothetical protein